VPGHQRGPRASGRGLRAPHVDRANLQRPEKRAQMGNLYGQNSSQAPPGKTYCTQLPELWVPIVYRHPSVGAAQRRKKDLFVAAIPPHLHQCLPENKTTLQLYGRSILRASLYPFSYVCSIIWVMSAAKGALMVAYERFSWACFKFTSACASPVVIRTS